MDENQMSGCPYGEKIPDEVSIGKMTYGDYLKVEELLTLQALKSDPPHPDELLFIVIHQAYELWFKLILQEMERSIECMNAGETLKAQHLVNRSVEILKLLVKQIHLLETMKPIDFLEFRDRLMPASGFQSVQFREIEFLAGVKDEAMLKAFQARPEMSAALRRRLESHDLRSSYYTLLRKEGFQIPEGAEDGKCREEILTALKKIYQDPDSHLPLYLLSESLLSFDEELGFWRSHHVVVVERVIGRKMGTGGSSGVDYLRSTLSKRAFPLLWEVRGSLEKRG